jgi:hypothetical protein
LGDSLFSPSGFDLSAALALMALVYDTGMQNAVYDYFDVDDDDDDEYDDEANSAPEMGSSL